MNRILVVRLLVLTSLMMVASSAGFETAGAAPDARSFAGMWKGSMNNLPAIDLTILQSGSKVGGNVVFYFQKRADVKSPWHATPDKAIPLLKPHVDSKVLTFEAEHHVCDGCKELGPNVFFRMELTGADEASLTRFQEHYPASPPMKLLRDNAGTNQTAPPLQAGISVQMPITENASPVPEADQPDALIMTVTAEGKVYLGIQPIDSEALVARLQATKSVRKRLYIKADSRAPYATVIRALDAASEAGIETTVLLTSQHNSPQPGALVHPNGIIVETGGCHCAARAKLSL